MRLAKMASGSMVDRLMEHFHNYIGDINGVALSIKEYRGDRQQVNEALAEIEEMIAQIQSRLDQLRANIGKA